MSRADWLELAYCLVLAAVIVTVILLAYAVAGTLALMLG